jgi:hypothetical protein
METKVLTTLLVSPRWRPRQLLFNHEGLLCGWQNSETGEVRSSVPDFDPAGHEAYAFGGIHVISPDIFQLMEVCPDRFSIIDFYLKACVQHPVRLYTEDNLRLIDAGSAKGIAEAEDWLSG